MGGDRGATLMVTPTVGVWLESSPICWPDCHKRVLSWFAACRSEPVQSVSKIHCILCWQISHTVPKLQPLARIHKTKQTIAFTEVRDEKLCAIWSPWKRQNLDTPMKFDHGAKFGSTSHKSCGVVMDLHLRTKNWGPRIEWSTNEYISHWNMINRSEIIGLEGSLDEPRLMRKWITSPRRQTNLSGLECLVLRCCQGPNCSPLQPELGSLTQHTHISHHIQRCLKYPLLSWHGKICMYQRSLRL